MQRKSQNSEAETTVTTYYNGTRSSYIDLSLNSNYTLKMKTLYSPLTVNPTITP